jgi:hypothetical protein
LIAELSDPRLAKSPYQILELSFDEVDGMCANMFNLVDRGGNNVVVMSERARRTFDPATFGQLQANYKLIVANLDTVEQVGGGSARCMLAEKF